MNTSDLEGTTLDYWVARGLHDFVREIHFTDSGRTLSIRGKPWDWTLPAVDLVGGGYLGRSGARLQAGNARSGARRGRVQRELRQGGQDGGGARSVAAHRAVAGIRPARIRRYRGRRDPAPSAVAHGCARGGDRRIELRGVRRRRGVVTGISGISARCRGRSRVHRRLRRMQKQKGPSVWKALLKMARLAGFEPTTPWFVAKCSIQLSYSRTQK